MHRRPLPGTDLRRARSFNRRVVLETVRLPGPFSRADLARETTLSVQTVSNIVEELWASGLLLESRRQAPAARGAPGYHIAINPEGGATIGTSLDQRHAAVLLVDLGGAIRARRTLELSPDTAPTAAMERIGEMVERCP